MNRFLVAFLAMLAGVSARAQYVPSESNLAARSEFGQMRFGIFIHWGIYSTFAQGEWYLNSGLSEAEYSKAASAFSPVRFDARAWTRAIRDSGARYVTFTSRHHDGFSLWPTAEDAYNIVDGTPFGRDVVGELAEACRADSLRLHLYYSILDWHRTDYPLGRTGRRTGRTMSEDYDSYFGFMQRQVRELLTRYPEVGGIWLDGYWDHDADSLPFDWRMPAFYAYIHDLRPDCLVGNNHHISPIDGEDFQMFERDLPGENTAGLSGQDISSLPLEMCQTMNGMWGYKVADQNYKSVAELVALIARAAAKGSNLLLNIGPQPNGELPAAALERLQGIGRWMRLCGESIYGTTRSLLPEPEWGVLTQRGDTLYAHVLDTAATTAVLPWNGRRPRRVTSLIDGRNIGFDVDRRGRTITFTLSDVGSENDRVIRIVK